MEIPTPYPSDTEKLNIFMIKRAISLILLHHGFDSITSGALDTMVDIYLDYFKKIGSNLNFLEEFSNNNLLFNLSDTLNHLDPLKSQDSSDEEHPFQQVVDYIEMVHSSSENIQSDIENLKTEIDYLKNLKETNPQLFLEQMIKEEESPPEQESTDQPKEIDTIQPFFQSSSSIRSPSSVTPQISTPQTIVPPPPSLPLSSQQVTLTPIAPHIPPVQIEEQDSTPKNLTPSTSKKRRGRPPGKKNTNYK